MKNLCIEWSIKTISSHTVLRVSLSLFLILFASGCCTDYTYFADQIEKMQPVYDEVQEDIFARSYINAIIDQRGGNVPFMWWFLGVLVAAIEMLCIGSRISEMFSILTKQLHEKKPLIYRQVCIRRTTGLAGGFLLGLLCLTISLQPGPALGIMKVMYFLFLDNVGIGLAAIILTGIALGAISADLLDSLVRHDPDEQGVTETSYFAIGFLVFFLGLTAFACGNQFWAAREILTFLLVCFVSASARLTVFSPNEPVSLASPEPAHSPVHENKKTRKKR